MFFDGIILVDM